MLASASAPAASNKKVTYAEELLELTASDLWEDDTSDTGSVAICALGILLISNSHNHCNGLKYPHCSTNSVAVVKITVLFGKI